MTSVGDPLVGQLLDGRYQITHRLARGGMATVYIATDIRLTRTVAVKVMHIGLGDDAEFARKFDREARSAAKLSHPNVVSVFDQGHDDGRPYIVMEYVEGRTLRDILNHEAPLPPERALEIIEPVLGALAAAHEARAGAPRREARERAARPTAVRSRSSTSDWPRRSRRRPPPRPRAC